MDSIRILKNEVAAAKKELSEVQEKLAQYESIERLEENIDKGTGTVYREIMPNGECRYICSVCWESGHFKIPLNIDSYYGQLEGKCPKCKNKYPISLR